MIYVVFNLEFCIVLFWLLLMDDNIDYMVIKIETKWLMEEGDEGLW